MFMLCLDEHDLRLRCASVRSYLGRVASALCGVPWEPVSWEPVSQDRKWRREHKNKDSSSAASDTTEDTATPNSESPRSQHSLGPQPVASWQPRQAFSSWWSLDSTKLSSLPVHRAAFEVREYAAAWAASSQDPFWQRKSKKVVLAVVVCRGQDGLLVYRGMNTEVSLPSGSLCAERAAIASAASHFQRAADIVAIGVLDPENEINPLWPCEVCQSWLSKLKQQAQISVVALSSASSDRFLVRVNGELQASSF